LTNSFISYESPAQGFLFDLNSTDLTDLASDFNEFTDFYKNDTEYTEIERPQNPFHKNFQSYQGKDKVQRNSFSDFSGDFNAEKQSLPLKMESGEMAFMSSDEVNTI